MYEGLRRGVLYAVGLVVCSSIPMSTGVVASASASQGQPVSRSTGAPALGLQVAAKESEAPAREKLRFAVVNGDGRHVLPGQKARFSAYISHPKPGHRKARVSLQVQKPSGTWKTLQTKRFTYASIPTPDSWVDFKGTPATSTPGVTVRYRVVVAATKSLPKWIRETTIITDAGTLSGTLTGYGGDYWYAYRLEKDGSWTINDRLFSHMDWVDMQHSDFSTVLRPGTYKVAYQYENRLLSQSLVWSGSVRISTASPEIRLGAGDFAVADATVPDCSTVSGTLTGATTTYDIYAYDPEEPTGAWLSWARRGMGDSPEPYDICVTEGDTLFKNKPWELSLGTQWFSLATRKADATVVPVDADGVTGIDFTWPLP